MIDNNRDSDVSSDYDFSRATYYNLISKGSEALDDMLDIARSSEHPRAYEVVAGLMKNLGELNGELMNLQKKKKEALEHKKTTTQLEKDTQTNVFIGTTPELLRQIAGQAVAMKDVTPDDS